MKVRIARGGETRTCGMPNALLLRLSDTVKGKIVLVKYKSGKNGPRAPTFLQHALRAQRAGAVGLILGHENIRMEHIHNLHDKKCASLSACLNASS